MKIVSTAALSPANHEILTAAVPGVRIVDRQCRSMDEITELVSAGCDVLLSFRMPDDVTRRARGLKWVQLLSAGADHALGGPLKDSDVPITTSSGIHATPIAEYTLASMLAYAHRLHLAIRAQLRGEWMRGGAFVGTIDELRGKTLGIVGYGSIGRETARLGEAFGMPVLALKRDPGVRADLGWCPPGLGDPGGKIPRRFYSPAERMALLAASDYLAITLPLTPQTRGFIGAGELAATKPGAYLVNIGRGEVIDEKALIEALSARHLGGAGLDVFEREPLPADSPFWKMENVILTPHISGANRAYMDRACALFAENLRRFASKRPLLNLVDRTLGY